MVGIICPLVEIVLTDLPKIWGRRAPPAPPVPTALNRTVTSINAPRALTFEASKVKMNLSSGFDLGHNLFCCKGMCIVQKKSPALASTLYLHTLHSFCHPSINFLLPM